MSGLRLALTIGVPGPWGESAKKVFEFKGLSYVPVAQHAGEDNDDLVAWTGIRNAPVAVWNDEPGRANFQDIVALADRLAPDAAPLVPEDPALRVQCLGISAEICGEGGFGWTRRVAMADVPRELYAAAPQTPDRLPPLKPSSNMARAYRPSAAERERAQTRVAQTLDHLAGLLEAQQRRGSNYFVGAEVSACDIHWACFSALLEPLPDDVNPMPGWLRVSYSYLGEEVEAHKHPILLEHRNRMFERHLGLPLDY